ASYFGALDTLREQGLRVPEDISVAGYDGIRSVQAVRPRLTTVRQDSDAMGRRAALRLIDHIDHPNTAISDSVLIPTMLIEGESLGEAPRG
ncbi:MAG: substrate-binding domain-containing protein, partial [Clostridia bacterium]|nr:substrate-binding domain-containing protein [Clostridia bacterium]